MDDININEIICEFFINELNLVKEIDEKIAGIGNNFYFIDKEKRKYLICYTLFKNGEELIEKWEEYQDEYISGYLQLDKFYDNDIKWDVYYLLIYNDEQLINVEKKLSIERDKFSCKKSIIHAINIENLIEQLKEKLPVSKNYYPINKSNVIDYEYFIKNLCDELDVLSSDLPETTKYELEEGYEVIYNILELIGEKENE